MTHRLRLMGSSNPFDKFSEYSSFQTVTKNIKLERILERR